jgi:hypothetical protein
MNDNLTCKEQEKLKKIMSKYSFYEKQEETEDKNGEINEQLTTFYECYVDDSQRIPKIILEEIWEEAAKQGEEKGEEK